MTPKSLPHHVLRWTLLGVGVAILTISVVVIGSIAYFDHTVTSEFKQRLWSVPAERGYYGRDRAWQRDYVLKLLAGQDGNFEIIPYRANRAIIFDSRLIHQTEEFVFDESHAGRRANITIAYGSHHSQID
jgi:hypothetical protein